MNCAQDCGQTTEETLLWLYNFRRGWGIATQGLILTGKKPVNTRESCTEKNIEKDMPPSFENWVAYFDIREKVYNIEVGIHG